MFLVRQQTPPCAAGLPCSLISGTLQRSQIAELLPGPPGPGGGGDEAQVA